MADYGIKTAKPGIDVITATPGNLSSSSRWGNFKIVSVVTGSITMNPGDIFGSGEVLCPVSYAPVYDAYIKSPVTTRYRSTSMMGSVSMPEDPDFGGVELWHDNADNKFKFVVSHTGSGTRNFIVKIVVYADSLLGSATALASTGDYGLKVSTNGEVSTDVDGDLSMTSKFRNLTIAGKYSVSGAGTVSVSHNVSGFPVFEALILKGSVWVPIPASYSDHSESHFVEASISSTTVYLTPNDSGGTSHSYRVTVFNEKFA